MSEQPERILQSMVTTMRELDIGRKKLYRLLNAGQLQSVMMDGRRRILTASVRAYVESLHDERGQSPNPRARAAL